MLEREQRRVSAPIACRSLPCSLATGRLLVRPARSWKPVCRVLLPGATAGWRVDGGASQSHSPLDLAWRLFNHSMPRKQSSQLLLGDPGGVMGRVSLTEVSGPPDPGYGVAPPSLASLTLQSSETLTELPLLYLSEYAFGTYYVPGMVLGAEGGAVNNTNPASALMELTLEWNWATNKMIAGCSRDDEGSKTGY